MIRVGLGWVLALAVSGAAWAQAAPAPTGNTAAPAATLFKAWDKDHNGSLSPAEFSAGWQRAQAVATVQAGLHRQFASLDGNHDRGLDAGEYGAMVLVKRAGKAAPPLARFDANGNGRLEFAEYARTVEALMPKTAAKAGAQ